MSGDVSQHQTLNLTSHALAGSGLECTIRWNEHEPRRSVDLGSSESDEMKNLFEVHYTGQRKPVEGVMVTTQALDIIYTEMHAL